MEPDFYRFWFLPYLTVVLHFLAELGLVRHPFALFAERADLFGEDELRDRQDEGHARDDSDDHRAEQGRDSAGR